MVLFPRIGTGYWIVTDFYETFCAVPVTLVRKGGLFHYGNGGKGLYTVEWRLAAPGDLYDSDTGYVEEYDVSRRDPQQTRLAKALEPIAGNYDYCIIDNAPDIALNTINALVASDYVLIPAKLDKFVLEGLEILIDSISEVQENFNSGLVLLGSFITMLYNDRYRDNAAFQAAAMQQLEAITGVAPFKTAVGRSAKVDESTYSGKPILEYSRGSAAALGYVKLTAELLERM